MSGSFPLPKLTVLITTPDVERLAAFYTDSLGFTRTPGTPPGLVALSRGAAEIALTPGEAGGSAITLSLLVDDLAAWRADITDEALIHDIQDGLMGLPTLAVADPDGNRITLSARRAPGRVRPQEPGIHLLPSHAVRVSPDAEELADAAIRLTGERRAALQLTPDSPPPTIIAGGETFTTTITPRSGVDALLEVGGLMDSMSPGDDLLITPRQGTWTARRLPAKLRDEAAIAEANRIAERTALEVILADTGPVSLERIAAAVHERRGWGGAPPDELHRIIAASGQLALTPLQTVVPGPDAATGSHGAAVTGWNRRRLGEGLDSLTATSAEDLEAALSILGLRGDAAEAMRTTRRLAKGETHTDAEALTRQLLSALLKPE